MHLSLLRTARTGGNTSVWIDVLEWGLANGNFTLTLLTSIRIVDSPTTCVRTRARPPAGDNELARPLRSSNPASRFRIDTLFQIRRRSHSAPLLYLLVLPSDAFNVMVAWIRGSQDRFSRQFLWRSFFLRLAFSPFLGSTACTAHSTRWRDGRRTKLIAG